MVTLGMAFCGCSSANPRYNTQKAIPRVTINLLIGQKTGILYIYLSNKRRLTIGVCRRDKPLKRLHGGTTQWILEIVAATVDGSVDCIPLAQHILGVWTNI